MKKFNANFINIQDVLRSKWVPEILISIENGCTSFSSILINVPYLSQTELTRKIKLLLHNGLIEKAEAGTYALRPFGKDLLHILICIQQLNEKYTLNTE